MYGSVVIHLFESLTGVEFCNTSCLITSSAVISGLLKNSVFIEKNFSVCTYL